MIIDNSKRIAYFDVFKGVLIMLIPIHHFSNVTRKLGIVCPFEWIVTKWQFVFILFFMSAFFFASGYCTNYNKPKREFLMSQVIQLLLPYVVFSGIDIVYWNFKFGSLSGNAIFHSPYTAYWFLNALFAAKILHYILLHLTKSARITLFISFFLLCFGVVLNTYVPQYNILAIYNSLIAVFFVSFGYTYKIYERYLSKYEKYTPFIYVMLILLYMGLYFGCDWNISYTAYIHVSLMQIPLFCALSIIGTIAVLHLSKRIGNNKVLEFYGRNSLVVYMTHFFVLYELVSALYYFIMPMSYATFLIFLFVTYT